MSAAHAAAKDQFATGSAAALPAEIDRLLRGLQDASRGWSATPIGQRVTLLESCLRGLVAASESWVTLACEAKGIQVDSPVAGEEWSAGPLAVARYLQLLRQSLRDLDVFGRPRLPGSCTLGPTGRWRAPVLPSRGLFDRALFAGFRANAWLERGVDPRSQSISPDRDQYLAREPGVCLVLGAGNVSSIAAVDALDKLFQQGQVVLLKLNPVNDYLEAPYRQAFAPLIERGALAIVRGGASVGGYAAGHSLVDAIHVTGSKGTQQAIAWGPPGAERERRMAANTPLLSKPITSELGNVTPWIVLPGEYSERQLDFQARNVAAMIVNNASFNCIAVKAIVTWSKWPDRERFLDKVAAVLTGAPPRVSYYRGARDRYARYAGRPAPATGDTLPWTLLRNVTPSERPELFREESFVCVCAETALAADTPLEFLDRAVDFVNEQLWGTLGAGLMVPAEGFEGRNARDRFWQAIDRLDYGAVAINQWPALAYAIMSAPWGGKPGGKQGGKANLNASHDPQSGHGWVHNAYFLSHVDKTVLEGPLTVFPQPFWFPSHGRAQHVARRVFDLYARPSWGRLLKVVLASLRA